MEINQKPMTMSRAARDEALQLVRDYKRVITPRFPVEPKVYLYGSYSKGYAKPESDIDDGLNPISLEAFFCLFYTTFQNYYYLCTQ